MANTIQFSATMSYYKDNNMFYVQFYILTVSKHFGEGLDLPPNIPHNYLMILQYYYKDQTKLICTFL